MYLHKMLINLLMSSFQSFVLICNIYLYQAIIFINIIIVKMYNIKVEAGEMQE